MQLTLELYRENDLFCAYLGDDCGGSGISLKSTTSEGLADQIKEYVKDYLEDV